MPDYITLELYHRLPNLQKHGIEVERFENFVNTDRPPHHVDVLLVSFLFRGEATHVIEDMEYPASPGSVGITRSGESHRILTTEKGVDIFNVYLDPVRHPLPLAPFPLRKTQQVLFPENDRFRHLLNRSIHFQLEDPDGMKSCLELLIKEGSEKREGSSDLIAALLRIIVITCCRSARRSGMEPGHTGNGSTPPSWIIGLCQQIDERYAEDLTLHLLSRQTGLSRGYLCRAFKKHVGLTLGSYLTHRRIQAAMQALRATDEKILSVALECGFNDLSHFNRTFKSHTGRTPSAFRNNGP